MKCPICHDEPEVLARHGNFKQVASCHYCKDTGKGKLPPMGMVEDHMQSRLTFAVY